MIRILDTNKIIVKFLNQTFYMTRHVILLRYIKDNNNIFRYVRDQTKYSFCTNC